MSTWIEQVSQNDVQTYLQENEHVDARDFVLKHKAMFGIPSSILADQLRGRKKAKDKHPLLYQTKGIFYPPSLNIEQSSSVATAQFKVDMLKQHLPVVNNFVDLTGGFGIDTYYLSTLSKHTTYVEPDQELLSIVKHNHQILGARSIDYVNSTAESFLKNNATSFTLVYIDPSRRVEQKKTFKLDDCIPNITILQSEILNISDFILVKAAPWLDIDQALRELKHVRMVFVVSVADECKELLFFIDKTYVGLPFIKAVNLNQSQEDVEFSMDEEKHAEVSYSDPSLFLYEPNSAIMKAGAFKLIAQRYALRKIHQHTHWYTSDVCIAHFPGRIFRLEEEIKSNAKDTLKIIPSGKANVVVRNYPLSAEALKQKLKLKDGGDVYVLGFTGISRKHLFVASRIK
jgi:16S rRNA G966 N2-methylase RsmD